MAASSSMLSRGLGLVLVEFQYEYEGRDGELISIKPNERYTLLAKTNDHWWQVRSDGNSKPFYIPAKYVKELPSNLPSPLDFADPPAPEPAPLPAAAPVPVPIPVPVPVPKAFEDTKPKAGDEVMIRLRPDSSTRHHKNENRMSTFGVPLDSYDLTSSRYPNNTPAGPTETGIPLTSEAAGMTEGTRQLLGLLENHRDSGNARVPSFSPADPIPAPRTHTQPIPVDVPVVPPHGGKLLNASSNAADPHDSEEIPIEPDEEEELEEEMLQEEPSSEESMGSAEEEEEVLKEEDHHHHHHHIYESIQDLNLDLDALIGDKAIPAAPTEPAPSPPTTQSSLSHNSPIYANVSFVKKTSPPSTTGSDLPLQLPEDPAPSGTGHAPSPSGSSSGALSPASPVSPPVGWQTHTDQDSGKVFYYHPLTRQTTWSAPRSPPSSSGGPMDQSGVEDGTPLSPLVIPPSPQESAWEQLVEETSGRFYYYNRTTGATSWTPPELLATSPPGSTSSAKSEDGPPPLPKADYPVSDHSDSDSVFTVPLAGLIPRAHLDLKEPNSSPSKQQEFLNLPQRMVGNGVPEEGALQPVKPWRHSVAEDTFSAGHHRNLSDLTDMNRRNSPDSPQLLNRYGLKRNLSDRSTDSRQRHCHMLEKAGILNKTKVADNGKKIRKNWSQSWTVLHGGILTFHKDPKSAPTGNVSKASQIVPEYTVELRGSSVGWASKDKSSKKHVLELKTRQGCEYLMQYDTESIICDWLKVIQDTIKQLEEDHLSDDEEDVSDKEDKDRKRTSNRGSSGPESEQSRVRTKLRRFLQRRPTLQSVKEKGYIRDNVFGCHLDTLCHRENSTIPKFVEKCIRTVERRGLDVDGIYRVSGNLAVIQKLRHKADHEEQLDLEDGQWEEIHVVTGALKLFLRELPEPLFPFSCFDKFIAAIQIPDHSLKVSYMKDLVQTLPLPNHDTMELLFRHLRKVIDHKESNRMSFQSVAIVFGPTLLRPQTESPIMTIHMVFQSQIVELILKEFPTVFSQR